MSMETLEFVIYPDGRVQEKVTGVVGQSCTVVTAAIESALGDVVSQSQTAEYFATNHQLELTATASNQTSW
jgi:L-serine deaminase